MNITKRLTAIRETHRRCCCESCSSEIEEHLDAIETELAEILTRLPAPDTTPAHITLKAT